MGQRGRLCSLDLFRAESLSAQGNRMHRFSTSRARQEAVFVIRNRLLTRAACYMRLPWLSATLPA